MHPHTPLLALHTAPVAADKNDALRIPHFDHQREIGVLLSAAGKLDKLVAFQSLLNAEGGATVEDLFRQIRIRDNMIEQLKAKVDVLQETVVSSLRIAGMR